MRLLSPIPVSKSTFCIKSWVKYRSRISDLSIIVVLSSAWLAISRQCKTILVSASSWEEYRCLTSSALVMLPPGLCSLVTVFPLTNRTSLRCYLQSMYLSVSIPEVWSWLTASYCHCSAGTASNLLKTFVLGPPFHILTVIFLLSSWQWASSRSRWWNPVTVLWEAGQSKILLGNSSNVFGKFTWAW